MSSSPSPYCSYLYFDCNGAVVVFFITVGYWRREPDISTLTPPPRPLAPPPVHQSLLLNEEEGCAAFRETVQRVCSGDEICTPALCAFREKAVNLLFLERDAFRHYRENHSQVSGALGRKFSEKKRLFCCRFLSSKGGQQRPPTYKPTTTLHTFYCWCDSAEGHAYIVLLVMENLALRIAMRVVAA